MTPPSQPFPKEAIEATARAIWQDNYARYGGPWESRGKDEIVVIQTLATALAALTAAAPFFAAEREHYKRQLDEAWAIIKGARRGIKHRLIEELNGLYTERDAMIVAEREACAQIADARASSSGDGYYAQGSYDTAEDIASAIRARSIVGKSEGGNS